MDTPTEAAEIAVLLDGLTSTGYTSYHTTDALEQALPLVRENEHGSRLPSGLGWTSIYQAPDGLATVFDGFGGGDRVVTLWTTRRLADAARLLNAREWGITPERAAEGVTSPHIGDDQRRMYEVVLLPPHEHAQLEATTVDAALGTWAADRSHAIQRIKDTSHAAPTQLADQLSISETAIADLLKAIEEEDNPPPAPWWKVKVVVGLDDQGCYADVYTVTGYRHEGYGLLNVDVDTKTVREYAPDPDRLRLDLSEINFDQTPVRAALREHGIAELGGWFPDYRGHFTGHATRYADPADVAKAQW